MRWLLLVLVCAGCGEPSECGTSVAEDIFVITAIDVYNATLGPTAGMGALELVPAVARRPSLERPRSKTR